MGDVLFANKAGEAALGHGPSAPPILGWQVPLVIPPPHSLWRLLTRACAGLLVGRGSAAHPTLAPTPTPKQVVPYSPTEDLPVQMFATSSHLPPLPPPSKRLRVSLMDAACASRGELEMHHIPFFFKGGGGGNAAHQAAALFVEQPS